MALRNQLKPDESYAQLSDKLGELSEADVMAIADVSVAVDVDPYQLL